MSFIPQDTTTSVGATPASSIPPHPSGTYQAVCVDVVNLGILGTPWGPKKKVRLYWETAETYVDARTGEERRYIISQSYTATLTEGSNLRKDLQSWRGQPFTDEELQGFELDRLVGANCILSISQGKGTRGEYAFVTSIAKAMKGMRPLQSTGSYIRVKDRSLEDQEKFFERVHNPQGAAGASKPAPAAPAHSPKALAQSPYAPDKVPAALQDEEDDLPF